MRENNPALGRTRVVPVAVAPNEVVADIWRQVLEDEGIIAALRPGGAGASFATNALNEHVVLVREDQAERAREVLAELESSASEES
jgi:hypothetical protein